MKKKIHIAIDGPAGAGKSTVAKKVAERLGISYLDTGAMYRVVAYKVLKTGIPLTDEAEVVKVAQNINIEFDHSKKAVYCDGEDVTQKIRNPEVSSAVAIVATYQGVREHLVKLQRQQAEKKSLVMDGIVMATHGLPEAQVKIYLTASVEERAKRRYLENINNRKNTSLEQVRQEILNRDKIDSGREHSPLKPADDAFIIDTTDLTVDQVVDKIVKIVGEF